MANKKTRFKITMDWLLDEHCTLFLGIMHIYEPDYGENTFSIGFWFFDLNFHLPIVLTAEAIKRDEDAMELCRKIVREENIKKSENNG